MTRRRNDPHRRIAERDRVAVTHGDVVARKRSRLAALRPRAHVLPIGHTHDDACAEVLLQIGGAAEVIAVGVRNDHVFDVSRVEAKLAHAADDGLLDVVVEHRVEQDDALRRRQRPRRHGLHAEQIEVVEHLDGRHALSGSIEHVGRIRGCVRPRTEIGADRGVLIARDLRRIEALRDRCIGRAQDGEAKRCRRSSRRDVHL